MKRLLETTLAALAAILLVAGAAAAQGTANFTRYVALGDSLTHGFASGGVIGTVQANSYPALIARQAGATDFQQPLISAPGIPPLLALQSLAPGPVITPRSATPGAPTNLNLPRPYNNLGVSGFRVRDVLATVTGNGLIDTVLRGQGTSLQQALALRPTFVTLWIGNNDVLAAATSGRVVEDLTLTRVVNFQADYRTIVSTLRGAGAQVAVATIPSVTSIPFVTAIPPVVVNPATREPVLVGGQLVPLIGPSGPLSLADRVLLTASSLLAQGIGIPAALGGSGLPLPDGVVLSASEVATIETRRAAFNDVIRAAARDFGAVVVPTAAAFDDIAAHGFPLGGGVEYTTEFLTGGIFSYDGVHPTSFGYAAVANVFIEAINGGFGTAIPVVDLVPFAFGPDGSAGSTVPVSGAASFVFTSAAYESLRTGLGIPSQAQLDRVGDRRGPRGDGPGAGPAAPSRPRSDPEAPERPGVGGERGRP